MESIEIKNFDNNHDTEKRTTSSSKRIVLGALVTIAAIVTFIALSSQQDTTVIGNAPKEIKRNLNASNNRNPYERTTFHQSGFGGLLNVAHPHGHRARRFLSEQEIKIPKSAVDHAIPSLSKENIQNLSGHYVHDEHRSPFSSFLYKRPREELEQEQRQFETKMNLVREKWGAWDFKDDRDIVRPLANFESTPYKDLPNDKFPASSWQTDEKYVRDFISEANKLVDRMMEGIYAEYGYPTKKSDGTVLSEAEIETRNELFKVHITNVPANDGLSYINKEGMDALSRKLLHGMITNDEFYFVLGGHSAAAGHGNNFLQQKTMQFHHIMEPVFDKLGMRLISRNLAMGGLGTIHYSMGQAELYGEKDFLMWDSAMTEKNEGDRDLFNKQALINGERVPILFTPSINRLVQETGGRLWNGNIVNGHQFLPMTTGPNQVKELPLAARYMNCDLDVRELCGDRNNPNKYDAHCWVPRSDYEPAVRQSNTFSSQASWHPGNRYHQFESRKAAMTILHGFKGALKIWEEGIDQSFPLAESHWHIGDIYETFQEDLLTYMNGEGRGTSVCEKHLANIGLERVCRTPMHAMAEFTPINLGSANSIHANMKNEYVSNFEEVYSGVDLLPLSWKIPIGEVDVHAIAIASTYKSAQIIQKDSIVDDDDFDDDEDYYDDKGFDDDDIDDDDEEDIENERLLRGDGSRIHLVSKAVPDADNSDRKLPEDVPKLIPGKGWGVFTPKEDGITGYCDGSSMSFNCKRSQNSACLLSGHNDGRQTISGDGLSGWLVIQIPKLKKGLIFAKMEWWHPRNNWYLTNGWTEVNGGNRSLGKVIPYPSDVFIDIALNGKVVNTLDKEHFEKMTQEIAYNEAFYKFFDDEEFSDNEEGESVEFGFRIRSESDPRLAGLSMTHLYYA